MNVNRVIDVHENNAVKSLQSFLFEWWRHYNLDALLAPVELAEQPAIVLKLIEDPGELEQVNPFVPLMTSNAAIPAIHLLKEHPHARLAVMLRPCELRAFVELQKRELAYPKNSTLVIGVDCLGTFSQAEYARQVEKSSASDIILKVLRNASEGGLRQQNFRTACQICDWPAPRGADMTVGFIGVPSDQSLVVIAQDEAIDQALKLDLLAPKIASEYMVSHRELIVGAIADARAGMRHNMIEEMEGPCRFDDLGCILACFANCSLCGKCLEACPLYSGELAELINGGGVERIVHSPLGEVVSLGRWLASCSGCGMCEEECTMDVPLFLLITALSHRIREKMHYCSGDPVQHLPWVHA